MRPPRQATFARYHLRLEIAVLLLAGMFLFAGAWLALDQMSRDYLRRRQADAAAVKRSR